VAAAGTSGTGSFTLTHEVPCHRRANPESLLWKSDAATPTAHAFASDAVATSKSTLVGLGSGELTSDHLVPFQFKTKVFVVPEFE
jgi:hypothetical protein